MEGYDPARTRSSKSSIALPVDRQRVMPIAGDKGVGSPVAIAQDVLLVEVGHQLRAVDIKTGKQRWAFTETGSYISPAAAGNTVFIRAEANNEGQMIAIDLASGQQRWAFKPRRLASPENGFWGGHLTSPVVANGLVFVGAGKEMYALDASTGATRWEYSGDEYVVSSATIGDGRVFYSDAKHFYALDQHTGALTWKSPSTFAVYFSPIVAKQTVFFTDGDNLVALNTADGTKRWETGIPNEIIRPGGVQGSRLFVKSTSTLYALDVDTGKVVWRFDEPSFVSFPAIAGDKLFAVTGSTGQTGVSAIDITTGKRVWAQKIPTLAGQPPVIAGQSLYLRTTDGNVLSLSN